MSSHDRQAAPLLLASLVLLALLPGQSTAQQRVYANFLDQSGTLTDSWVTANDGTTIQSVAVPFKVPADGNFKLSKVEIQADQFVGTESALNAQVVAGLNFNGVQMESDMLTTSKTLMQFDPSGSNINLTAGTTYYLEILVNTGPPTMSKAHWYKNAAGDVGTVYTQDLSQGTAWVAHTNEILPAFRILATPTTTPAVIPSTVAFSTLGSNSVPIDASLLLELICPAVFPSTTETNPFSCNVAVSLPVNATSCQVCQALRDQVNAAGGPSPCWGTPPSPSGYHAECDGNVLRVTNNAPGLCAGAYVCADHLENLNKYFMKKSLSQEYFDEGDDLALEMRGAATTQGFDASYAHELTVTHTRRQAPTFRPQVIQVHIPLTSGMPDSVIASLLVEEFARVGDHDFVRSGRAITIEPPAPVVGFASTYDIAVRMNDQHVDWTLSPFSDLIERSDVNPPPVIPGGPPAVPAVGPLGLVVLALGIGGVALIRTRTKAGHAPRSPRPEAP